MKKLSIYVLGLLTFGVVRCQAADKAVATEAGGGSGRPPTGDSGGMAGILGAGGALMMGGTSANAGGHAGTGGGGGGSTDCSSLAQADCETAGCAVIMGSNTGQFGTFNIYFCRSAAPFGCASALFCGYPPGHPEDCLVFREGCVPDGWTSEFLCETDGCPKPPFASGGAGGGGAVSGTGGV
jgi:hypothetical protein